MFICSGNFPVR